jgi:micrococcal nuclease
VRAILAGLLIMVSNAALAHQVIGIADGDTLTLLVKRKPLKIRLADIDAPEKRQAFGLAARQSLASLCRGRDATYVVRNADRYGRMVARVTCAGLDVNRAQVERGMAWVYTQYNSDPSLPAVQAAARLARRGLWADPAPVPPWEFRHPGMTEMAGECLTGRRGGRYQMVNGRKRYGC